jgi:hypothetical protein
MPFLKYQNPAFGKGSGRHPAAPFQLGRKLQDRHVLHYLGAPEHPGRRRCFANRSNIRARCSSGRTGGNATASQVFPDIAGRRLRDFARFTSMFSKSRGPSDTGATQRNAYCLERARACRKKADAFTSFFRPGGSVASSSLATFWRKIHVFWPKAGV